jgi:hypothetical protein
MRKIIMYASLSWTDTDWKKKITWNDLDFPRYRGALIDQDGRKYAKEGSYEYSQVMEDIHIMFALEATKSPAEITITPIGTNVDPQLLKINKGFHVYVGNGFLYWETGYEEKSQY